ncbi:MULTISPECIES: ATP-binding protein [unclassified Leisingera]|uniref:ATP-binding protein n=1 Tax=unclassified Leisingera TaxID=2614906 RepID=UPI000378E3C0|nr:MULTISPECIES: ATP-binding protein [unclassified Leisingera]KIC18062.1 ATPase [Leisingera sp. ANG-DT]KIC22207.1 ATPase [Leisingera sp. ANG-S3]KIC27695.1 ATPase [Leisingera sp. ANG-M6]KIC32734.1 ATPase [Leisingera sp. ANG-S5]KIC53611.1 ATPase [Leisingera sp. ANG-S]
MVKTFACSFTATNTDARSSISSVVARLRTLGIPSARADEVQIALTEAVNNVVEHAYADATPGDVRIKAELTHDRLWISIQDAGSPFPNGQLPEGKPADVNVPVKSLPEGGFGWFLIRELASQVQYERSEGSNNLTLCFEIQVTSPSAEA